MLGGDGNDVYYVDNPGDIVKEFANVNSGIDTVRSTIDYTLPENVENLYLQGSGNLNGTGNALDNTINGNSGNNHLYGLAGDDCLVGKDGRDFLDGGIGNDVLIGGAGDDTYFFAKGYGHDIIQDSSGNDTLCFGQGITASDLILSKSGDDLSIKFKGSNDSVLVDDWFANDSNKVENFSFADGSSLNAANIAAQIQEQTQNAGIV